MPLPEGEGAGLDHGLVGHHRIVATPAKSGLDVFQGRQGLIPHTELQIGRTNRSGDLLQQPIAEREPGFSAKIEPFDPERPPLVLVDQPIKQPAGIHIEVELTGKIAPKKCRPTRAKLASCWVVPDCIARPEAWNKPRR